MSEQYVTLSVVRRRFGVSKDTVRKWVAGGILHPVVFPGQKNRRYLQTELDGMLKKHDIDIDKIRALDPSVFR